MKKLMWQLRQFFNLFPEPESWAHQLWMWRYNRRRKTTITIEAHHKKYASTLTLTLSGNEIPADIRKEILDGFNVLLDQGFILGHVPDPILPRDPRTEQGGGELTWDGVKQHFYPGPKWIVPDKDLQQLFDELDGRNVAGDIFFGDIPGPRRSLATGEIIDDGSTGRGS